MKSIKQREDEKYEAWNKAGRIREKAKLEQTDYASLKMKHKESLKIDSKVKDLTKKLFALREQLHNAEIEQMIIDATLNGMAEYLQQKGCSDSIAYIKKHGK